MVTAVVVCLEQQQLLPFNLDQQFSQFTGKFFLSFLVGIQRQFYGVEQNDQRGDALLSIDDI